MKKIPPSQIQSDDPHGDTVQSSERRGSKNGIDLDELLQGPGIGKGHFFMWSIQFLVGMMHLAVYFTTTILIPYLRCEWDLDTIFEIAVGSISPLFITLGGLVVGNIADQIGRKKVLISTTVLLAAGSVMIAASHNVWMILVARAMQGMCTGIGYPVAFVYAAEVTNSNNSKIGIFLVFLGSQLGGLCLYLMSSFLLKEIGWRLYLIAVLSAPFLLIIVGLLLTPETPRYLLARDQRKDAIQSLKKIYHWNGVAFPDIVDCAHINFADKFTKGESVSGLFHRDFRKLTILLSITFFANLYISLGFAAYLPLATKSPKEMRNLSSTKNASDCDGSLDQEALMDCTIATLGDIAGCIFTAFLISKVLDLRIKVVVIILVVLTQLTSITGFFDLSEILTILFHALLRLSVSGLRYLIWLYTAESFPTILRGTASTFVHAFGDAGGTVGCFLTYLLYSKSPESVVGLFVGIAWVQLVASLLAFMTKSGTKGTDRESLIA